MTNLAELDAQHYMRNSKSQYSQARELIELIDIQEDFSILDIGCGYGNIIAELAQSIPNGKAIGIDISQNMISLANATYPSSHFKNLHFMNVDAEKMSFPEMSFDLIICTNVLMWIRKPKKVLELMGSYLKVGGQILIFTYPKTTPYAVLFEKVLNKDFPEFKNQSAVKTMLALSAYKDILIKQGLEILLFQIDDIVFSYKNEEDFKNYIRGWLSCYAPIPNESQETFLEKICNQARLEGYYSTSGQISIAHQTLKILGRKVALNR